MTQKRQKVLVIGSNSFSGSDFIDLLLAEGRFSVTGISRSGEKNALFLPYKRHAGADFRFYQMDLNKDMDLIADLIRSAEHDYVINFAAQSEVAPSWENPEHWFQTNSVAATRLFKHLSGFKFIKRYVHISTPEVYGTCEGVVKEDAPLNPSTPYAASKAAGDLSLYTFHKQYGLPAVYIRSTNVYGAHQQLFKIIPRVIIYGKLNKVVGLHGGGKAIKSYIHIRDVSRGELAVMENGKPGDIYHLSPDSGISVRDVVKMICDKMNRDFEQSTREVAERPGQDKAYVIDSGKARSEFGWKPVVSFDEGISGVVEWIEREWNNIEDLPHEYIHQP